MPELESESAKSWREYSQQRSARPEKTFMNQVVVTKFPVTDRVREALAVTLRGCQELIPQEDRYRLGGPNTVRGYAQDELSGPNGLGGLAELLLNVEARLHVAGLVSVVGFLDAGNVWPDRKVITWKRFVPRSTRSEVSPYDLRYTFGGGLRVLTPVGPVRLDYARRWNNEATAGTKDSWYVGLGHAF